MSKPEAQTMTWVRISPTVDNDYANRCPDWLPAHVGEGLCAVTLDVARQILADAEFNSDKNAVDVGPNAMPLKTFNAYAALAKQIRATLAEIAAKQSTLSA
jgi:hypothetical protein